MTDLQAFLDRQLLRPLHVAVLVAGMLMMFIDGFDTFMLGKIAPAVAAAFHAKPAAMAQVFVGQQIGLAVGAFLVSPMADVWGRRSVLAVSAVLFGLLTLAAIAAPSLSWLAMLRGFAGVPLAAVVPMVIALVGEIVPARVRGGFVALTLVGYSFGNAAASAAAAWLLTRYGWTSAFWVGGVFAVACAPLFLMLTPESPLLLAARNPADPRLKAVLRRIDPVGAGDVRLETSAAAARAPRASFADVWRPERARATLLFWIASGLSVGGIALVSAWMPTLFQVLAHVPIPRFGAASFFAYLCGIPGIYLVGYLLDRFGARGVTAVFYIGYAVALLLLGVVAFGSPGFLPVLVAWSLFQTSAAAALNLLISRSYPPLMRSTALGWAGGVGRIVGIFTPLVGAYAVAHLLPLEFVLAGLAVNGVVIAALAFAGGRAVPNA